MHIARARKDEERGYGESLVDVERACRHYGITPGEYYSNPQLYPLPERRTRISQAGAGEIVANLFASIVTGVGLGLGYIFIERMIKRRY